MFYRPTTYASSRKTSSYTVKDFSGGVQTVTDENVLPLNYSAGSYNFSFKSGALKDGFGVKESELDGGLDLSDISVSARKKTITSTKFWFTQTIKICIPGF